MKDFFVWLGTILPVSIMSMTTGAYDFSSLTNIIIGGVTGFISMTIYSLRD